MLLRLGSFIRLAPFIGVQHAYSIPRLVQKPSALQPQAGFGCFVFLVCFLLFFSRGWGGGGVLGGLRFFGVLGFCGVPLSRPGFFFDIP